MDVNTITIAIKESVWNLSFDYVMRINKISIQWNECVCMCVHAVCIIYENAFWVEIDGLLCFFI